MEGNELLLLTPDNIKKYLNKTVMMRSPMSCLQHEGICNKCAGELFAKQEISNVGLYATQLSFSALNFALKAKHDTTIKLYMQNPDTMITDI